MIRVKEKSLQDAMEAVGLQSRGLPHRYQEGKDPFWIRALVLVQKRNLEECYCLYQQNADKYMSLVQDFGTASPIMSIKGIYPYMYLDEARFIPSGCLQAKKDALKNILGEDPKAMEVDEMTEHEVMHNLVEIGIERQLKQEEEDRIANQRAEGSDIDGTNYEEIELRQYQDELEAMKKDGCSKAEIKAFKEEFAAKHKEGNISFSDEDYLSEDEKLRMEMESKDLGKAESKESEVSVEGEFDEPEIDYEKVLAESEEHRLASIRQSKRKWKRGMFDNAEKKAGNAFENEFGETEVCETLDKAPDANEPKRKPGRPKKQVRAGITKRKNNAAKRAAAKKGE